MEPAANPELLSDGLQTFLVILGAISSLVASAVAWLHQKYGKQIKEWIASKTDNEWAMRGARALEALATLVNNAVTAADATYKAELAKAKDPASPGGASLTKAEGEAIKNAVFDAVVQSAGGWGALATLVGAAFGNNGPASEAQVRSFVNDAIETRVAGLKKQ